MKGSATYWAILIVVALIAAAMLVGLWPDDKSFEQAADLIDSELWQQIKSKVKEEAKKIETGVISAFEKAQIEAWLVESDLNKYGDPRDTIYGGGTPLFNEQTGEAIDRYEYIIANHPDKPWKN